MSGSVIVRRPRADFGSPNRGCFPACSSVWRTDSVPASRFHGIPGQTERLTEAQAESDGYGKQGFEPMTSDSGEELLGLLGC